MKNEDSHLKNQIRTAAVWGAGAVGSYFIWGLSEKLGENLCVIAEGERKTRLETEGLRINGRLFRPPVRTPREAHGVDLLLIAVKYGALPEVAKQIDKTVGDDTIVLSLLNGVDSEEILGRAISMNHIVFSMMQIASERMGNEIRFYPERTPGLFFGETNASAPVQRIRGGTSKEEGRTCTNASAPAQRIRGGMSKEEGRTCTNASAPAQRIHAIEELLADTPIRYHVSENILKEIWLKYAFNVSMNLPQAIIGCGIGAMAESSHMTAMRRALRDEVAAVAAAKGIDISEPSAIERMKCPSAPASRYSTLQDLDAKRPTEIEMFSGTVMRLGQELGVATPCNAFAYHAIRALEEKNEGKFLFAPLTEAH